MLKTLSVMLHLIRYEIMMTLRTAHNWLTPLLFFIITVSMFPLALGPDTQLLHQIAPGILWVSALLATLLSINQLFRHDVEEGYIDLLLLSPYPLNLLVLCKIIGHWISYCLPLVCISPLLGLLLNLNAHEETTLCLSLLLGTPVFILLGAIGSALTVGIRHSGLLLPILILPLYIPILIFGTGALLAASHLQPLSAYFAMMGALILISLSFAPSLTSAALRIGVHQ